ncbi:glucose-6-phosphate isomerase [candidate division MSBL1 archaeon SCGC-AAA259D18]|uniref:glucose-6-phosphate isomerase n=1 Tax=candidate division MSBL1 archaeon SCGC-AAA259D18 TaxID=1698262 RepID=A0A133UCH9_9EURY|nr:glucose-6-phosphate isomerase [candidate division MSBL1 archaeon SCGC-AAA259D18]
MANELEFGEVTREPDIRLAKDMKEVIQDIDWLEENKDAELYYMYRDLWHEEDEEKILSEGLRYDITVIPPLKMGCEYVKTKGHYHPEAAPGITYPEIYEVLEGEAHYLLQKRSSQAEVEDVVLIQAEAGNKALIPPNYGHITINPSEETLKMANWVDRNFDSIYKDILELGGGAYFEMVGGGLVKNENYEQIAELRYAPPTNAPEIGIKSGMDMYDLIQESENLKFLSNPQDYQSIFEKVL